MVCIQGNDKGKERPKNTDIILSYQKLYLNYDRDDSLWLLFLSIFVSAQRGVVAAAARPASMGAVSSLRKNLQQYIVHYELTNTPVLVSVTRVVVWSRERKCIHICIRHTHEVRTSKISRMIILRMTTEGKTEETAAHFP